MKIIINPTKPFYLNEIEKKIRCGNFPETGKIIDYEDEKFVDFFSKMTNFIDISELKRIAIDKYSMTSDDFNELINYLLFEKFIISDAEFEQLYDSNLYNRQNAYFFMVSGQTKKIDDYKHKTILILGLGGIGCNVAEQLARAGFQNFIIADCDIVENSNLIRQNAYYINDIGLLKTNALEHRLKQINSRINIEKVCLEISSKCDIINYISKAHIVVCTLDKPYRKIRRIINDTCITCKTPVIFSGFAEHVGMVGPFVVPYETACLECIDKAMEEVPLENVKIVPSFGPLCNIISSIVASEIINFFTKYNSNNLIGCTLMFNMINYDVNIIKWDKNHLCKRCGDKNDSK